MMMRRCIANHAAACVLLVIAASTAPSASAARPMIATGQNFSLALQQNGSVFSVGSNIAGQLGNDTTTDSSNWVSVANLNNVVRIAAGAAHALALERDGTVWTWGSNFYGQLGDDTTVDRKVPARVTANGFTDIVAIAATTVSSYALDRRGRVWAWGANGVGQLGDGTTTNRPVPVMLPGVDSVTEIAAGFIHVVALRADGTVRAWGGNTAGQLGDGTTLQRSAPVPVPGLTDVVRVAASFEDSYALLADGTVRAWGSQSTGALGNGASSSFSATPVSVLTGPATPLHCAVDLAAGFDYALATTCSGTVMSWGLNDNGQLGLGNTSSQLFATPQEVTTANAAGVFANSSESNRRSFVYLPAGASGFGDFLAFGSNGASDPLGTGDTSNHLAPTPITLTPVGAKAGRRTNFSSNFSRADVFWRNADGTNAIWDYTANTPTGFSPHVLPGVETTWSAIGTGDVNGDAASDVVWLEPATGQVAVWLMANASTIGSVTFPASVGAGTGWQIQGVGDMDGDTYADILWRNTNTGEALVWYMKSDGTIDQALSLGVVPLSYQIRALADVDGDWLKDIVWFQPSTGQVVIWNMHPSGSYTAWFPANVGAGSGWDVYKVGDFDGDGREDLFWRNGNGATAVWYLNGPNIANVQFLAGVPLAQWSMQALGDYDADGREDILWLQTGTNVVARWRMLGRLLAPAIENIGGIGPGWQSIQ
jgi:alpha-tubulin suppressor-like RCC1 family protein